MTNLSRYVQSMIWIALILSCFFQFSSSATTTSKPSFKPSFKPTLKPSQKPTPRPSRSPTVPPSQQPSSAPTALPTVRPTVRPTSRPTSIPTARPTSHPTHLPTPSLTGSSRHSNGKAKNGLSPGGIAGVVIAVVFVVIVMIYLYQHHFYYLKRFVNITINGTYNFLPGGGKGKVYDDDNDEQNGGGMNMFGLRRDNFPHQYTASRDHDDNLLEISNPMIDDSSIAPSTPGGGQSPTLSSVGGGGRKHMDSIDSDNGLFTTNPMQSYGNNGGHDGEEDVESERIQINSTANITKSGYLLKQSTGMKWLKRFFFIKDNVLYYSKKPTDFHTSKAIPAVLVANLVISTVKEHTNPDSNLEFQIISPGKRGVGTGGGVYCLQAENENDYNEWISTVKQCIAGSLSSNLAQNSSTYNIHSSNGSSMHAGNLMASDNNNNTSSMIEMVNPTPQQIQRMIQMNPYCADCGAKYPDWASLNLAILICIDCSGVHRSLGTHVSKVRSLKLDKWSQVLMNTFQVIGNENANKIWEAQLPTGSGNSSGNTSHNNSNKNELSTSSNSNNGIRNGVNATGTGSGSSGQGMKVFPKDSPTRETFIRSKYVDKRYMLSSSSAIALYRKQFEYDFLLATYKQDYLLIYKCLVQGVDVNCIVTAKDFPNTVGGSHHASSSSSSSSGGNTPVVSLTNKGSSASGNNSYHDPKLFDHSALMLATISGNLLIIELLLNWGANVEVKNSKGFTACDYAQQKAHVDVNELLISSSTKQRR